MHFICSLIGAHLNTTAERYLPAIIFIGATLLLKIFYWALSMTVPKGDPQQDMFSLIYGSSRLKFMMEEEHFLLYRTLKSTVGIVMTNH